MKPPGWCVSLQAVLLISALGGCCGPRPARRPPSPPPPAPPAQTITDTTPEGDVSERPPAGSKVKFVAFDTPPEPIFVPTPRYPRAAREAGLAGMVIVMVTVDETGRVSEAEVEESTSALFDDAALEAAREARFKPARQPDENGRQVPVPCRISIPFRFHY